MHECANGSGVALVGGITNNSYTAQVILCNPLKIALVEVLLNYFAIVD